VTQPSPVAVRFRLEASECHLPLSQSASTGLLYNYTICLNLALTCAGRSAWRRHPGAARARLVSIREETAGPIGERSAAGSASGLQGRFGLCGLAGLTSPEGKAAVRLNALRVGSSPPHMPLLEDGHAALVEPHFSRTQRRFLRPSRAYLIQQFWVPPCGTQLDPAPRCSRRHD